MITLRTWRFKSKFSSCICTLISCRSSMTTSWLCRSSLSNISSRRTQLILAGTRSVNSYDNTRPASLFHILICLYFWHFFFFFLFFNNVIFLLDCWSTIATSSRVCAKLFVLRCKLVFGDFSHKQRSRFLSSSAYCSRAVLSSDNLSQLELLCKCSFDFIIY